MERLEIAARSIKILANTITNRLAWLRAYGEAMDADTRQDILDSANAIQTEAEKIALELTKDDPTGF